MVAYVYNPPNHDIEAGGLGYQESKAHLGYMRLCLKQTHHMGVMGHTNKHSTWITISSRPAELQQSWAKE